MWQGVNLFFERRGGGSILILSIFAVAALGVIDHSTGYEVSFSVFYLVPIALAAWYGSLALGLLVSFVSAATWLTVDFTAGHTFTDAWIPYWNAGVRLVFFVTVCWLLCVVKRHLNQEKELARTDPLTGTLNGRAFRDEASKHFAIAKRTGGPISIAYMDVDNFKAVNDQHGHQAGDSLLRAIGQMLNGSFRQYDIVARLGGDEFAVLMPLTESVSAVTRIQEIRGLLDCMAASNQWPVSFSVGIVTFSEPPSTVDAAILEADKAMYEIKHASKNAVLHRKL